MKTILAGAAIVGFLVLWGWYHASIWNECRSQHSFFYCFHVLG